MKFRVLLIIFLLGLGSSYGQNSLNSGDFTGAPSNTWGAGQAMSASAGTSLIITKGVSTSGNKFFRFFGDGSPCGEYQPTTNGDFFTHSTVVTTPNGDCGNTKAWQINVPTTSSNVVFKTDGNNTGISQSVAFVVQGAVQTVSSVAQAPVAASVFPGQGVLVTATMSGVQSTGQNVYIRYTTNNFSTSTVAAMTYSGSSATFTIPAAVNTPSANVRYYIFTSGTSNVAADGSNADFFTINLNNNGSFYQYTVASGWITAATGAWTTAGTWTANAVPPTTNSMGTVTINHNVTSFTADAVCSSISIGAVGTLTASSNTLTINNGNTGTTFTRNATGTYTASGTHTVVFSGAATHTVSGTVTFQNVTTSTGLNFGAASTISATGTFQLSGGGFVSTNPPTYTTGSTLAYNSGTNYGVGTEWTAGATSGAGYPSNVSISNTVASSGLNFGASNTAYSMGGTMNLASTTATLALSNGSGNLNIGGDWTRNASSTFTPNSRTVTFNGTAAQAINSATTFFGLSITNALANVTAGAAVTVTSVLTINGSATLTRLDMGANTLTLTGATTTVTSGFLRSAGTITGGTNTFGASGTYEHNYTNAAGTIPTATWSAGSTCSFIGYTSGGGGPFTPGGLNQAFSNFTWNCPAQTQRCNLALDNNASFSVGGTFNLVSTNAVNPGLSLSDAPLSTFTRSIANFNIQGGNLYFLYAIGVNGTYKCTITTSGNYSQSGGTVHLANGTTAARIGVVTFNIAGNFSHTAGTFQMTNTAIDGSAPTSTTVNLTGASSAMTVSSNFNLVGNSVYATALPSLNLTGATSSFSQTAGTIDFGSGSTTGVGSINLAGAYSRTGNGAIITSGASAPNGVITFNGGSGQTITNTTSGSSQYVNFVVANGSATTLLSDLSINTVANTTSTFTVNSGGTINFGTFILSGVATTSTFVASTGSTLVTANTNATGAIMTTGANGSVQTSVRTFTNTGVNYTFNGASAQFTGTAIGAATNIQNLTFNTTGSLTLSSASTLSSTGVLSFGTSATTLIIGANDLTLTSGATVTGAGSTKYVQTASTGQLKRTALTTAFTFPVGNSAYNPITLTNTGTSDTYGIIARDGTVPNALDATKAVNRYWAVTEGTGGGGNLAVTAQFNTADGAGVNYSTTANQFIGLYPNASPWAQNGSGAAASGSNPFTVTASGFTNTLPTNGSTFYFAVGISGAFVAPPSAPTISSISASVNNGTNTGYVGSTVTVNGSGFLATGMTVKVGGIGGTTVSYSFTSSGIITFTAINLSGDIYIDNGTAPAATFSTYTNLGYITTTTGPWNTPGTWLGSAVPVENSNATIAHAVSIAAAFTPTTNNPIASITVNTGITLTASHTGAIGTVTNAITTVGSGVFTFSGAGGSIIAGSVVNAGTLSWSAAATLNISSGGSLTNSGTFTAGTGTVTFAGTGTVTGTVAFNNLTLNGALTNPTTVTVNGTLQLNTGATLSNSPAYGTSSTLVYNQAGSINNGNEWVAGASGAGVPQNVTTQNTASLTLTGSAAFTILGNLNITSGSTLALSTTSGGNLNIRGNWSRGGTFTPNSRTVTFNGTAAGQTINNTTSFFDIVIDNTNAAGVLVATSNNLTVTNSLVVNASRLLDLNAGIAHSGSTFTVNGTLRISSGGFILNASPAPVYGSASNLVYNSTGTYGVSNEWSGNSNTAGSGVPQNVTIQNSTTVTMPNGANLSRGCAGNFTISSGGVTLGNNATDNDLYVGGNLTNNGTFTHTTRAVFMNGTAAQTISGTFNTTGGATNCFAFLIINNSNNVSLGAAVSVNTTLTLTSGLLVLGANNLTLNTGGVISNAGNTRYVQTNGAGQLRQIVGNTNITYAVGNSSYNPVILNNSGTSDTYGVNVLDGNVSLALDATYTVNRRWQITEAVSGNSNLAVTSQYNTGEENTNYNSGTTNYLGFYNGTVWVQQAATRSGSNPFTVATNINFNLSAANLTTGTQYFAIGRDGAFLPPPPTISSFTPTSGYTGTSITINGTFFTGVTSVTIGGVAASYTVNSTIEITATVPQSGASGSVAVTNGGGTASLAGFTYLGYITKTGATTWATGGVSGSWLGDAVPPAGATTTIAHNLYVATAIANSPATITVNNGITLTVNNASGAITATTSVTNNGTVTFSAAGSMTTPLYTNAGILSWSAAGILNISAGGTLTNNGTFTRGTGTVVTAGAATINGSNAITFNNLTITTGTVALSMQPNIDGTFRINGGSISTNAPIYTSNSTLQYGVSYTRFLEWSATGVGTMSATPGSSTPGYPNNVTVGTGTLTVVNSDAGTARAMAGNLQVNTGCTFTTGALNAILTIGGSATTTGTGSILMSSTNARLAVLGSVSNAGTLTLSSASGGDLYVAGNLTNTGTFTHSTRAVFLNGTTQTINAGFNTSGSTNCFDFLFIQNNSQVTLAAAANVRTNLNFTSGDIILSTFDLTIGGTISSPTSSNFIITNSTGQLRQTVTSSAILFPVGNTSTTYNPITLTNAGTSDVYGIRVLNGTVSNVSVAAKTVNRSWFVTEGTSGGSNLTPVVAQYNTGEEGASYNAGTTPYMGLYNASSWTVVPTTLAGANPFTATSTGTNQFPATIPSGSYFAIGKDDVFGTGANDFFRSITTGNWSSTSTWQSSPDNTNWYSANAVPGTGTGTGTVTVRNGHTVTVDYIANPATLTIASGGTVVGSDDAQQLRIGSTGAGTLTLFGTLTLNSGLVTTAPSWLVCGNLTIGDGGANNGIFNNNCGNAGAVFVSSTFTLNNGSTYNHNAAGSSVNGSATDFAGGATTRTFGATSNCNITKWAQTVGSNSPIALPTTAFGNLTINLNHTTAGSWQNGGNITSIQGDFTVTNTGGATRQFRMTSTTALTLNIGGNVIVNGGFLSWVSGAVTPVINITKGLTISSGTYLANDGNGSTVNFIAGGTGDIDISGGTNTFGNTSIATGRLCNILNTSNLNIAFGRTFTVNGTTNIAAGAIVLGAGAFTVANANTATLGIASVNGITISGATGNVQTTTRTFNTGANYVYNGSANQTTGSGLPASVYSLTINNTGTSSNNTVTLTRSGTTTISALVNPSFGLTAGLFSIGTGQNIDISSTGGIQAVAGDFANSTAGTVTFKGTGSVTGTVNFYPGVIQAPSSSLGVNYGTASTIQNFLRLDVNSFVDLNSPKYGNASTLIYNTTGAYSRGLEWTSDVTGTIGITVGYPNNVQISNNTTLNYYNATNTGPKGMNGNFVIDVGSSITFGGTTTGGALTVLGNVTNAGTITLGAVFLDDLKLRGNYANTGTGTFNGNNRAIWFINPTAVTQTVSSATALTIPFVVTSGAGITVQLLSDVVISSSPTGTNVIIFGSASDIIDLNGKNLTIGASGNTGVISGTGTFKGSSTSNLTLLGTGSLSLGTLSFTSGFQNLGTLTMNRTSGVIGVTLGSALTINNSLVLTNGLLDLAGFNLTMAAAPSGTITSSTTNFIIADGAGELRKVFTANGSFVFPIGDNTGTAEYSPATLNFTGGSYTSAFVGLKVSDAKHPNNIAATDFLTRFWTVTSSGITSPTYSFTGTYISGMADISGTEANSKPGRWDGTDWIDESVTSISGGTLSLTGLTSLPPINQFTAGAPLSSDTGYYYRSNVNDGNWNIAANWQSSSNGSTGWVTATTPPSNRAAGILIRNLYNINSNANRTADDITIETGATLTISGGTFTLNNGTAATDLQVNGTLTYSGGTFTQNASSSTVFDAASTYNHSIVSSTLTLPIATGTSWNATSNCNVTGMTNSGPITGTNMGHTFGNFNWNNASQGSFVNIENSAFRVNGTLTVGPTTNIDNKLSFGNSSGTFNNTVNTIIVTGGQLNGVGNSAIVNLTVTNGISISGGIMAVSDGTGTANISIGTDLSISGNGGVIMLNKSTSPSNTLNITRDLLISGINARIDLEDVSSDSGVAVINVGRDFTSSTTGTTFPTVDFGTGSVSGNVINIARNFDKSGNGFFFTSSSSSATGFSFNGNGATTTQTFSYSGTNSDKTSYIIQNNAKIQLNTDLTLGTSGGPISTFTLASGGTLDFQTNGVIGNAFARFITTAGANLITSNTNGLGGTTATGSVRSFGISSNEITNGGAIFADLTNYTFNGATTVPFPTNISPSPSTIGSIGTLNINANVTSNYPVALAVTTALNVNGTSVFKLYPGNNNDITLSGVMTIAAGATFDNNGTNQITSSGTTRRIVVNGTFITRDPEGFFGSNTSIPSIVPELNVGSTVEYGFDGDQAVQGSTAPIYKNITFSGGGTKTLASTNAVTGTISVLGTTIFEAGNHTFGSGTSNITMTGTSVYKLGGSGVKPDSGGTYTLGNTSTIEFTGTSATQIRVAPIYANIVVSGSNVKAGSTQDAGLTFQSPSTFTVKNNGVFKVTNTEGFTGSLSAAIKNSSNPTITLESGSRVEFSGNQVLPVTQTITPFASYSDVGISGTGTKTLANTTEVLVGRDLVLLPETVAANTGFLQIDNNRLLTVQRNILNTSTKDLVIKNGGNLVQIDEVDNATANANTGNIKMTRTTRALNVNDYVYWGSPIKGNVVSQIPSPFTANFDWNLSGSLNGTWNVLTSTTPGKGFISRLGAATSGTDFDFTGIANNGTVKTFGNSYDNGVTTTATGNTILLGNPYPCAVDGSALVTDATNINKMGGTLYFWTSITPITNNVYNTADYATWNGTGGVGVNATTDISGTNALRPTGNIASGQGFFATLLIDYDVTFKNSMRKRTVTDNAQFFRSTPNSTDTSNTNNSRIWLNLTGQNNAFREMLVGYVDGATNDYDNLYDGRSLTNNQVDIYSIINTNNLVIQGRALPFMVSDLVPIGYRVTLAGNYTIAINEVDGLFLGDQNIYIEDTQLNIIHNLKQSPYVFTSQTGIFNNRFLLRYTNNALSNPDFETLNNSVVVSTNNGEITINSSIENIQDVIVFDMLGRQLFEAKGIYDSVFIKTNISRSNQTLIVKIKLENGTIVTRKIIL